MSSSNVISTAAGVVSIEWLEYVEGEGDVESSVVGRCMKVVVGSQKIDLRDGGKVVGLSLHKSAAGGARRRQ